LEHIPKSTLMSEPTRTATDAVDDADLSGRQLDDYRLLRRLGQGAMAEVYLAEQSSLRRQVAVKVLRSNLAIDATYVQRFHQEARAAAQLVHANIVQIHEVGFAAGVHFIAQEYVQGLNLAELLARRGPPELSKALDIMRQVAAALHKAAEQNIVHRDIKPENIMLASSGEVKVADFGLARLYNQDAAATNLTQIGMTMGTPLYMSPEQVEGKPLDPSSDIYSLGVTSYQMLSGEPPFRGDTALGIAVQHLNSQPARLENVRPDLPPSLCRIVHKMLAKDPANRYPTPRQLLHELRAVSIELFEEDPGIEFDGWGGELTPTVAARRQATERLAAAMKTSAMPTVRRDAIWRWVLLAFACSLAGTAAAWGLRELPLVTPQVEVETVERQETAESQYIYASMLGTEEAWKSVPKYFPDDPAYGRRAMQHLARLYLQEFDYERALKVFGDFARMNDAEVQFKAFGLAGEAIVLNRQNKHRQSADKLAQLWPLRDKLEGEMRNLVMFTMRSNRNALGDPQPLRRWNQWFKDSSPAPPSRPAESSSGKAATRLPAAIDSRR
jgi:eukaryotic-like serine/threonine-protein kinase